MTHLQLIKDNPHVILVQNIIMDKIHPADIGSWLMKQDKYHEFSSELADVLREDLRIAVEKPEIYHMTQENIEAWGYKNEL